MNIWNGMLYGVMALSIFLAGLNGPTLASDQASRLVIHSGRLTAQFVQVPLRSVLAQLKDQLHITYVAPEAELEKRISVTLQNEPLSNALSTILAPWDYAFSLNAAGRITTLYVMAKIPSDAALTADLNTGGNTNGPKEAVHGSQGNGRLEGEYPVRLGHHLQQEVQKEIQQENFLHHRSLETSPVAVQMEIQPPAPGTSMPVLSAILKDMPIIPVNRNQTMNIIPPTAYPPMNIQPVQEHVKQEMLLTLTP